MALDCWSEHVGKNCVFRFIHHITPTVLFQKRESFNEIESLRAWDKMDNLSGIHGCAHFYYYYCFGSVVPFLLNSGIQQFFIVVIQKNKLL